MVVALLILLPVICVMTGIFTAWGIYTGLKWQIQITNGREPTKPVEVPDPFVIKRQAKAEAEMANILDEYLNGPKEGS